MRFRFVRHGVVDSTSERAFASIAAGEARDGDVHVAQAQTAGRGRHGRIWHSPAGEGLYLSLVLLPPPPAWSPAALTMAAGLAALDAVEALGFREAWLKWPNDLVASEAKLAGVLVETRGFAPERPHYVIGIGLNVRQRAFPAELVAERPVTSLALLGLDVALAAAEARVLEALAQRIEQASPSRAVAGDFASGSARLAGDFLGATHLSGARACVRVGDERIEGDLVGLSIETGLCLRDGQGRESHIPLELVRELHAPGPRSDPRSKARRSI